MYHRILRFAFRRLYTQFAWVYDFVATCVSFGEWKIWGATALGFIPRPIMPQQTSAVAPIPHPPKVLEIAHGPGHLHFTLYKQGYTPIGVDLSPQMGRMAYARLRQNGHTPQLAQASALQLPFADASFDALIATFPTEFITAAATLTEARRVLRPKGVFIIVTSTSFIGRGPLVTFVRWLYTITGQQSGDEARRQRFARFINLGQYGFVATAHIVPTKYALVEVWVLRRIE